MANLDETDAADREKWEEFSADLHRALWNEHPRIMITLDARPPMNVIR